MTLGRTQDDSNKKLPYLVLTLRIPRLGLLAADAASRMAFMLKKKRYKFQADLCLEEQSEVAYGKAILFAKVRQLDGGSFTDVSKRYGMQF